MMSHSFSVGDLSGRHVGRDHLLVGDVALELDDLGAGIGGRIDQLQRLLDLAFVIDADLGNHQRRMIGTDLTTGNAERIHDDPTINDA